MNGRQFLRELIPPVGYRLLRVLNPGTLSLVGPYKDWEAAVEHSSGYNAKEIVDKVDAALQKVRAGEAAYERDSVLFNETSFNYPLVAVMLRAAMENNKQLSVLDFGGSLGSTYYQNRSFLTPIESLEWHVVEQESFVSRGRQQYGNEELRFFDTLEQSLKVSSPQVLLLCSVLQYLERPYALLEKILDLDADYIVIERTPFSVHGGESIMVQKVPSKIYKASYPAWIFDREKMLRRLGEKYDPLFLDYGASEVVGFGKHATRYLTLLLKHGASI
jgi:putative methyltransferase (TIGR04325 family)